MTPDTETGYLNGIELEMVDISDHFEKSIVKYEYPYVDGADLEDLGQKAGTTKTRCFFYDNAGQQTYDRHVDVLNLLQLSADLELIHPKYGLLQIKIESVDVRHDERKRCAEIDFSFVKRGFNKIQPAPATAIDAAAESAFVDGDTEQQDEAAADLAAAGFDTGATLDPDQGIAAQLAAKSASLRGYARELDRQIAGLSALATEITQPINSLVATINYGTHLPGRVIGIATKAVERVARLYDTAVKAPGRSLANLQFAFGKLAEAASVFSGPPTPAARAASALVVKHLIIACARCLALEAAYAYADDETARQAVRTMEKAVTFDRGGNYIPPETPAPIMNVRELEASLALVRTAVQNAVDQSRAVPSLKVQALQLLSHVSTVKLEREKIITVEVSSPIPLHLVCLKYRLPYNYAERILSINPQIANPDFVSGAIQIYTLPDHGGTA